MKTKVLPLILIVSTGLAACDKIAPPSENAAPIPPAAQTTTTVPASSIASEFPEGIVPDFDYRIRSKSSELGAEGIVRRLVVEFREGDVAKIDKKLEAQLTAKGYKRYKTFINPDGGVVGDYGAPNERRVTVTTSTGTNLALNEGALGIVYFVWK